MAAGELLVMSIHVVLARIAAAYACAEHHLADLTGAGKNGDQDVDPGREPGQLRYQHAPYLAACSAAPGRRSPTRTL
jgi:hypothetical protein